MTVAALYVDPKGVYADADDVDLWDEARDARLYAGPWPVVAHPPCARWCRLAGMIETRFGYRIGDDGGCFAAALGAVRRFGGVLEHPAHSLAWPAFGLPRPSVHGWSTRMDDPGFVTEVEQGQYGHALRKPTWVYAVGLLPPAMRWATGTGATLPHRDPTMSATARERLTIPTPPAFRDALLAMARAALSEREPSAATDPAGSDRRGVLVGTGAPSRSENADDDGGPYLGPEAQAQMDWLFGVDRALRRPGPPPAPRRAA